MMTLLNLMAVNPVIVDADTDLDEAIRVLDNYGFRHLPVVECDRVVGILSDRDVRLATGMLPARVRLIAGSGQQVPGPRTVREIMRSDVLCASASDAAADAAQLMVSRHIGALPIVDDDKLVGIVTETNLLTAFVELCEKRSGTCDDLVRYHLRDLDCEVHPDLSVEDALGRIDANQRHMVVVEGGKVVGVLSDRDLLTGLSRAMIRDAKAQTTGEMYATTLSVREVMSDRVVSIDPGSPMSRAARTMLGHRFSALPVIEDGKLLGILTQRDLLAYFASVG